MRMKLANRLEWCPITRLFITGWRPALRSTAQKTLVVPHDSYSLSRLTSAPWLGWRKQSHIGVRCERFSSNRTIGHAAHFFPAQYEVVVGSQPPRRLSSGRGLRRHQPGFPVMLVESSCFYSLCGERGRNRTYNLVIKSHLLCQLSYAPWFGLRWHFGNA